MLKVKRMRMTKLLQLKNQNSISQCLVNQGTISIMEQHQVHLKDLISGSTQEIHTTIIMVNRNSKQDRMK